MIRPRSNRCASRDAHRPVRLAIVLALLAVFSCAVPAGAQKDPFKEHYDRAAILFKSGQYARSIEEFQAAYEARPVPLLLFNLAQAHRKSGHPREALDLYERFLHEAPDTDLRGETEGYLKEVRAQLLKEQEQAQKPQPPPPVIIMQMPPPPPVALKPPVRRHPLHVLKWVAAGIGLGAIIAGATLIGLDGHPTCDLGSGQTLCPQQLDTQNLGIGVLSGGLAVVGGAAVLFVLDYRDARREGTKTAMPTLAGRF